MPQYAYVLPTVLAIMTLTASALAARSISVNGGSACAAGEYEMNTLANFDNPLPHIWPKGGVWGLQPFLQGHYSIGCD